MKLQNLTNDDILCFCKQFNCGLDEFKPAFNNKYYLRMNSGYMGPQPEFNVDETSCIGINYYKNYDLTKQWIKVFRFNKN